MQTLQEMGSTAGKLAAGGLGGPRSLHSEPPSQAIGGPERQDPVEFPLPVVRLKPVRVLGEEGAGQAAGSGAWKSAAGLTGDVQLHIDRGQDRFYRRRGAAGEEGQGDHGPVPMPSCSLPGTWSRPPSSGPSRHSQGSGTVTPHPAKARPQQPPSHRRGSRGQMSFPRPHSWTPGRWTCLSSAGLVLSVHPLPCAVVSPRALFPPHSLLPLLLACPLTTCSALQFQLLPRFPSRLTGWLEQSTEERPLKTG